MRILFGALIFVVVAGFTHIASLFALPRLVRNDAFSWLAKDAPLHAVAQVGTARLRSSTHIDPNFTLAVCRYNLSAGPLRIRIPLSDTFTGISFAAPGHGIFASVSDSAATGGSLDVVLATPTQIARISALDEEDKVVEEIRMRAPNPRGIAILSIFVDRPSARERTEVLLAQARCEQETLPD